jgi:hypothetical protein
MATVVAVGAATTMSTSPTTVPFGQATAAGNAAVLIIAYPGANASGLSSTGYTAISGGVSAGLYKLNISANEANPSIAWTGTPGTFYAQMAEVSGLTSEPAGGSGNAGNSSTNSSTLTRTLINAFTAGDFIAIGVGTLLSKAGTHTSSLSVTSPEVIASLGATSNDATSTASHYRFGYVEVSAAYASNGLTITATSDSMNLTQQSIFASPWDGAAPASAPFPYTGGGYYGFSEHVERARRKFWQGWKVRPSGVHVPST